MFVGVLTIFTVFVSDLDIDSIYKYSSSDSSNREFFLLFVIDYNFSVKELIKYLPVQRRR